MKIRIGYLGALLILVSPISVYSQYLVQTSPYIGVWCDIVYSPGSRGEFLCYPYTREYQGTVNYAASGIFQRVKTETRTGASEIVFTLQNNTGGFLRLIFFCKNGVLVTTSDTAGSTSISRGYEFCVNVPFEDGHVMSVHGTLITPSDWNPELSTPRLAFSGDLYVIETGA